MRSQQGAFVSVLVYLLLIICVPAFAQLPHAPLVGYWHNWSAQAAPYQSLDSIDTRYNVIPVSFAVPTSNTNMTMVFTPDRGTQQAFIQQIQRAQQRGAKVLLSVGGATASIDLTTTANRDAFATSLTDLLTVYGFDGLDIDIEHGASIVINGGTIAAPQALAQQHLIAAIKTIMSNYRQSFQRKMILTFAPETAYVQGGMSGYGSIWGGYLPIVDALRDSLDLIHVQLYNSGTMYGIDRNVYAQGTADFIVAMTEAVIKGFTTTGGTFTGLPASKVAVGLPACVDAAGGGYTDSLVVWQAMRYLKGEGPRPGQYTLAQQGGYPDLAGMMTWSINWDATTVNRPKYRYASIHDTLFGPPPTPLPDTVRLVSPAEGFQLQVSDCTLRWNRSRPEITAYHLEVLRGASVIVSDTARVDTTFVLRNLPGESVITWRVRARNVSGWGPWSTTRTLLTIPRPARVVLRSPEDNAYLSANSATLSWRSASPVVTDYHVVGRDQSQDVLWDTTIADTTLHVRVPGASSIAWTVRARNASGYGEWSIARVFHSLAYPQVVRHISPSDGSIIDSNHVELRWTASEPSIGSYMLRIVSEARPRDTVVHRVTQPRYVLDSLVPNSWYTWQVQAFNETGSSAYSKQTRIKFVPRPDQVQLQLPSDSAVVHVDSLQFTWSESIVATRYHIEIIHDSVIVSDSTLTTTSYSAQQRPSDTLYTWRVRAAGITGWGAWSDQRSLRIYEPEEPTSVGSSPSAQVVIAPNPAYDRVRILGSIPAAAKVSLCNLFGEEVVDRTAVNEGSQILSVAHLPVGLYVLRIGASSHFLHIVR